MWHDDVKNQDVRYPILQQAYYLVTVVCRVSLTGEGRRLLPIAANIVEQMRSFTQQKEQPQSMNIVAGKAFVAYELPRLIGEYRNAYPGFTCYVRSTLYEESLSALLTGTADIAFLGSEMYHPHIHQEFLPSDRILLVMAPEHPWARLYHQRYSIQFLLLSMEKRARNYR